MRSTPPACGSPRAALSTALLSEVQQIIPLVHIRVRESAVPDIYLSDRRVTVGGQLYLPRLIGIGEPGSDVLISQDIKGASDNVRFTFGNGDRVMTQLANDTDLKYAEIDLCLFHVNSGILLQLWKGVIQNFVSDGTPIFPVTCSDGFFQIMNQYPERQVSRQCWKTYNDGVNCPWATKGASAAAVTAAGGDPASCDYYLESAERLPGARHGALLRRAAGRPAGRDHQGRFHRLPGLRPQYGHRDVDHLGHDLGSGAAGDLVQLGRQPALCVHGQRSDGGRTATNRDTPIRWASSAPGRWAGSRHDGRHRTRMATDMWSRPWSTATRWQGLKVDGNLNVTKYQPGMGLRVHRRQRSRESGHGLFLSRARNAAGLGAQRLRGGTAACEIRIVKSTTIQPSTPDQHQMKVPIDYGMWGWTWDQNGNRTASGV